MKQYTRYIGIFVCWALLTPSMAQAQIFDRIKDAVKNKVEDRITKKAEETVDKGADSVENAAKKKKKKENTEQADTSKSSSNSRKNNETPSGITSKNVKDNSKFEFVPGNVVLYQEDFSQDVLDEFPLKWVTDNKGIVVNPPSVKGKWMRMSHSSQFMSPLLSQKLPDNFTVEFDLILSYKYDGYAYPSLKFRLMENFTGDKDGRKYLNVDERLMSSLNAVDFTIFPGEEESSKMSFQSRQQGAAYLTKEDNRLTTLDSKYGKVIKVSLWVQKQRIRFWVDNDKIYDIPQAIPLGMALNRLVFQVASTIQPDNEIGVYVSNIRVAAAGADTRSKLITEGKFSTNGILFDINSDKIKPASAPVLKEIAGVLKENPTVRVRIIGHTDSDGGDADNMELSKKRAAAVKQALSTDYGIEASRMETDGKGESQPVADNKSEDGKSQNRRVEFIKL